MPTSLQGRAKKAASQKGYRCRNLYGMLDEAFLKQCWRDIRKDEPYAAYDEMDFDVPIGTAGDTYDRYLVRLEEFRQSLRIIRQATEGIPEGPIVGKVPRLIKPAAGETYHAIESPKGELGYFIVSDGKSTNPYRFRVRPPSFCNLQGLRRLIKGHLIADVVALIGSLDVVLGEVDR